MVLESRLGLQMDVKKNSRRFESGAPWPTSTTEITFSFALVLRVFFHLYFYSKYHIWINERLKTADYEGFRDGSCVVLDET